MAYKAHAHVGGFSIAYQEAPATATIAVGDLIKWDASGDGVTPATAGTLPHLLAGIALSAGGAAATILYIPLVDGLFIESTYQTGTPAVGDSVQVYDKAQVNVFSNGTFLGVVHKVLNATTKAVRIMLSKSVTKNVTT